MKQLHRIGRTVGVLVEEVIPAVLMATTVVAVTADVVMRYVFDRPIRGVAEICLIAFIWMVYLSSAGAARRGLHISIDFIHSRLSTRGKAVLDVIINGLIAAVLLFVFVAGIDWLTNARFSPLPVTGWSKGILTFVLVVSAGLMLFHVGIRVVVAARGGIGGDYERPVEYLVPEDLLPGPAPTQENPQ